MKAKRHAKILEMISSQSIETQEDLLRKLKTEGFDVTQATVSRDIKELHLVKVMNADGVYAYSNLERNQPEASADRFYSIFSQSAVKVDFAGNIVVIKCLTGMAMAVCATLDSMRWESVVGTIGGDDTIFVLLRTTQDAGDMVRDLNKLLTKRM